MKAENANRSFATPRRPSLSYICVQLLRTGDGTQPFWTTHFPKRGLYLRNLSAERITRQRSLEVDYDD